jgi:tyrosine-protein kinase Etk/Wzc
MLFLFRSLVAWRRFIVAATLLTTVIAVVISLFLPKWFTASTVIFPPEQKGGLSSYSALLQNLQMPLLGGMGMRGGKLSETVHIDMMKSRHIGEQLIDEFDLKGVFGAVLIEDALRALRAHSRFTLLENGVVSISFEDQDRERAAAVANRYVELLDDFYRELNVTRAAKTVEFIKGQLEERKRVLAEAEWSLKQFQERNQALELEEQLRAAMTIVTDLTVEAIALETELQILQYYTSPTSDEYLQKKREYDAVLSQLEKLKLNDGQDEDDLLRAYIPTLAEIPELALEMLRLRRKVEIETVVYTMLLKEYEKSRIEEARDTPTIQVMDRASVPNLRSRPRRKSFVMMGAVAGLAWSSLFALFVAAWRENREKSKQFTQVFDPIRSDLSRVFRRKH